MKEQAERLDRRGFVRKLAQGALGGGILTACSNERKAPAIHTKPALRWRCASSFPRSLDTLFGGAEVLASRLEALTDGRFTLRPYPAGELVPALQVMDAVQQGTVHVAHTGSYYFTGKNPAFAFDTGIPFGFTPRQQYAWLYEAKGIELIHALFRDFDIITFPGGSTGTQMGGWFKEEIHAVSDLNGLKIRIPGLGGEVMSRLGATVQVIPGGEIYPALERGAIDAAEWVGPHDDEKLGFHKIAPYYYYPGWWEPGPTLSFYVNRREWEKLPSSYQEAFRSAARDAALDVQARYDAQNPPAFRRLLDAGVRVKPFPREILDAAYAAAFELYESFASSDSSYQKVYESWTAFRRASFDWFGRAELAYQDFAFRKEMTSG